MPYLDSLDIANRALQKAGQPQILSVTEDSKTNFETSFAYDKVRRAELRRNVWRFSTRKAVLRPIDTTTMMIVPNQYDSTKTYLPGAMVADLNRQIWFSMTPDNLNNTPGVLDLWDMYFGPLTVFPYTSTITYFPGELVYKAGAVQGSYQVYMSLITNNNTAPDVATAWDATITYTNDQVVSFGGSQWRSLIPINLNNSPVDGPAAFDLTVTYAIGNTVTASDNFIYTSITGTNFGNDPTTDGGVHWTNTNVVNAWSRTPTVAVNSINWLTISATVVPLQFIYPIGTGPASQLHSRNVFRLPSGFLREAPQDSKAGSTSSLGAPSNLAYTDWEYESDYLISTEAGPIVYRFVADVTKVASFDDMFCEGLACRLGTAICEPLTQSQSKLQSIASEYNRFMNEARTVNAIEVGATEPAIDDYISCRV